VKKQQIDVGVGKKPSPAKAASGDEGEPFWTRSRAGNDFLPELQQDGFDKICSSRDRSRSVAFVDELFLDVRRLFRVQVP